MSQTPNLRTQFTFISALWGLLFTKCFTLEFLVRHYEVPINSVVYVWTLSIFMASVATIIYSNVHSEERGALAKHPKCLAILIIGSSAALLVAHSLLPTTSTPGLSLALAAVTLSIYNILRLNEQRNTLRIVLAIAWLASAATITRLGSPAGFLVFAVSLFVLCVIPGVIRTLSLRRQG
ncbi:hypothetical protein ACWPKO_16290 [Coraliomargarita sp. W4R53]